jgi:TonB family protein
MTGELLLAALLQTQAPAPIAHVGGWVIYDNHGACAAYTGYGSSGEILVGVDYDHGENIVLFTVTKPAWESIQAGTSYPIQLRFSNGQTYNDTQAVGVRIDGSAGRMTGVSLRLDGREFLNDFAGSAVVVLEMDQVRLEAFNLQGTRAVMQRLQACSVASWRRYPPDPFAGRGQQSSSNSQSISSPRNVPAQRARANSNSYFSMDDYPVSALRENSQGTTGVSLTIDAAGRVSDCQVTASSGSTALDQATCRILRSRARYTPARDPAGNSTNGTDSARITWRLPTQ